MPLPTLLRITLKVKGAIVQLEQSLFHFRGRLIKEEIAKLNM
ncbi:hypothetical protein [Bacillus salipaludis]|nr:hypothetical protein [Bacillus salipaludis]